MSRKGLPLSGCKCTKKLIKTTVYARKFGFRDRKSPKAFQKSSILHAKLHFQNRKTYSETEE